jgi:hypothetical protein
MKLFLLIASMLLPQAPAAQTGAVTGVVVVSGSAQGIPDADILITSGTQKWDAVSDANGKFTLNNIPAGRHTLNIQADGYYAAVTGNSPTGPLVSMPVTAGQTVTVSMVRGGVISGKVVDTAGRPLIAAEVAAFKINEGTNRSVSNFEPVASRITDDRGEYRLFWLAPGEYFIAAVPRPQIDMTAARTGAPVAIQTIPTFFPNAAEVSGATKVAVKSGEEVRGIDVSARTDIPTERKITSVKVSIPGSCKSATCYSTVRQFPSRFPLSLQAITTSMYGSRIRAELLDEGALSAPGDARLWNCATTM